jgi:cell fate (sporulation/competence/biofilm development) regulator YlbF (YheA/YmcA/DUF963 family)
MLNKYEEGNDVDELEPKLSAQDERQRRIDAFRREKEVTDRMSMLSRLLERQSVESMEEEVREVALLDLQHKAYTALRELRLIDEVSRVYCVDCFGGSLLLYAFC